MTYPINSQTNTTALDRLVCRVDKTIAQCRRFEKMAAAAATWTHHHPISTLKRWLKTDDLSLLDREAALVALALSATSEAGKILRAYDPIAQDHALFYEVVCIEWEQRYREKPAHCLAA